MTPCRLRRTQKAHIGINIHPTASITGSLHTNSAFQQQLRGGGAGTARDRAKAAAVTYQTTPNFVRDLSALQHAKAPQDLDKVVLGESHA